MKWILIGTKERGRRCWFLRNSETVGRQYCIEETQKPGVCWVRIDGIYRWSNTFRSCVAYVRHDLSLIGLAVTKVLEE